MIQPTHVQYSLRPEQRKYTCEICGESRIITVRMVEKWVVVCSHVDTRGGTLPVLQLREEGEIVN